ncbi:hexose transporter hxt5 [Paecilomyces lecythidis]|uniref:Hexose transporter hxt5 n=1 Tax=Paecilomyces lecythidis TaxID=3004212 RepID=A0ABR3WP46_9EURO
MKLPFGRAGDDTVAPASESPSITDQEKNAGPVDETPAPFLTFRSFMLGAFVSIGGIIFGYDTGQISGFLDMKDYMQRFGQLNDKGEYYFSNVRSGLIVSLLSIGTLVGSLLGAPLADRIGRKWSISFWCLIVDVGLIIQISSPQHKWYQMMMGRFVTGLGVGACSLVVPMYQSESAPRQVRGSMIASYQLFITLGIFIANCINFGTEAIKNTASWRIPLGITFLWALFLGFGILLFPESPRYDFRHGRVDRAKRTMSKLYGVSPNNQVIVNELAEVKEQYDAEMASKDEPWYEMFRAPRMLYRILLGVVLQAFQQLTGANYYFYYGTVMFKGAGISNSYVTQMILGGVNFGSTFGGLYVIERFGRRKSLITGGIWMFVCFMIYASVGHFALDVNTPTNTPGPGKAMVVFACLFIVAYAMTWGPMVWAIVAELYPSRYRARSMAIATASNWLWNFLISFFTPFIAGDIDFAYGYVFAGCLFVAVLVVHFCVLESKGKTLEEIDTMYVMRIAPWKSSKWIPPPPEERITTGVVQDARIGDESGRKRTVAEGTENTHTETIS